MRPVIPANAVVGELTLTQVDTSQEWTNELLGMAGGMAVGAGIGWYITGKQRQPGNRWLTILNAAASAAVLGAVVGRGAAHVIAIAGGNWAAPVAKPTPTLPPNGGIPSGGQPTPTPTPTGGGTVHQQLPTITLTTSNMTLDSSQYNGDAQLVAPSGGLIVSVDTTTINQPNVTVHPAPGRSGKVIWKSAVGTLYNVTVSFT